jgi:hypothetical protein
MTPAAIAPWKGPVVICPPGHPDCGAAWSVAAHARMKPRAAEVDATTARVPERRAYAAAQRALDQLETARGGSSDPRRPRL